MPNPTYDRKKVRRAMFVAPVVALVGIAPFTFQLNLTFGQLGFATLAALLLSYLFGLLFGSPGYLLLRYFGLAQTKYLIAYAALLAIVTAVLLDDIYALLTFAPPIMLAAGTFCFMRGPTIKATEGVDNSAVDEAVA